MSGSASARRPGTTTVYVPLSLVSTVSFEPSWVTLVTWPLLTSFRNAV
jgi:hypothetical protein